jgi:lipoic acid synthetase
VTRDDLADGGAAQFAATVRAIASRCPGTTVEILVPDFAGREQSLEAVLTARPQVLNHNLETVPRLYSEVRPGAEYRRSLELLRKAGAMAPRVLIKSGLMLGLGERDEEVMAVMQDLRRADCDLLTLGQYLRPSPEHHEVSRFVPPEEFDCLKEKALGLGFNVVASGPLVRSSFHAAELLRVADNEQTV